MSDFRVRGRAAFVTGGASGIGLGLARALLRAGARVAIADVAADALARALDDLADDDAGGNLVAVALDVRERAQWHAARETVEAALGPVSILVNNAGVIGYDPIIDTPPEYFDWVIGVNLTGTFNGIHTFGRLMVDRGLGGHIVNTASISGLYGAENLTLGSYIASKFGAVGLSEQLRDELAEHGIGVSTLCPGHVATGLSANVARLRPVKEGVAISDNPVFTRLRGKPRAPTLHPDRLGTFIVQAIEENRAYILPHVHYAELVKARHREIMADFREPADRDVAVPADWRDTA